MYYTILIFYLDYWGNNHYFKLLYLIHIEMFYYS